MITDNRKYKQRAISSTQISLRSNKRYTLLMVIGYDLLRYGKLPLCLLICIIITAITVITVAYHTRLLITQREQLILEHNALDMEWRNLVLEENLFSDYELIEQIATKKLQMQYVDPSQENIIFQ